MKIEGITDKRILLSIGPMRTSIDPVRFIQNRSSGKMGASLAQACLNAGAKQVSLLLGPVASDIRQALESCRIHSYENPEEYEKSLELLFPEHDVFFSAAAVLDFEVVPSLKKIERSTLEQNPSLQLNIRPVPDFVARFAKMKTPEQRVIAFAAESGSEDEIIERAQKKMTNKGVDAMIANPVWPGLGPSANHATF